MSDYNFMKSGFTNDVDDVIDFSLMDYIESTMALLFSNAMTNASKYVFLGKRNTVTVKDFQYGLRYAAIEFFKNPEVNNDIEKTSEELDRIADDIENGVEDVNELNIVNDDDEENDSFEIVSPETLEKFEDIRFIKMMNHYYNYWDEWEPTILLEIYIKNAVNNF